MKFINTVILFCALALSNSVISQDILNESFEGSTFPPTGWAKKGGNLQNGANWDRGISTLYFQCHHSGQAGAISESYIYPNNVTPNNWLITPAFLVQTNDSLELFVKPSNNTYPAEHFEIKISALSSDTADFTNTIYAHTFTNSEGNYWTKLKFSLAQFNGQSIYIAFVHNKCNGQNMLLLDDVRVWRTNSSSISNYNNNDIFNTKGNILFINNLNAIKQISLFDISGRLLINDFDTNLHNTYNLNYLPRGVYLIYLKMEDNSFVKSKIIIN